MKLFKNGTGYLLWFVLFMISFSSCVNEKDFIYFQQKNKSITRLDTPSKAYLPILRKNDLITITVSAQDPEVVKPYNMVGGASLRSADQNVSGPVYLIDDEGNIDFPVFGLIKLAGLSKSEATELIRTRLKGQVINPIVSIKIINYRVTVLGDVARPGIYTVQNERITIPEALGYAGDLQITGKRKNILVISEQLDGSKTETRIDLTNKELFNSTSYFLNQNDVVYVEPGRVKIRSTSETVKFGSLAISATTLVMSLINFLRK